MGWGGIFVGMVSPVDLLICGPVEQGTSGMGLQVIEGPLVSSAGTTILLIHLTLIRSE